MSASSANEPLKTASTGPVGFITAIYIVQFFFGGWFLAHGLNHWFEFFQRPSGSSPLLLIVVEK